MQEEQQRGGVSVKQAPPLMASQSRRLAIDMRRRVATLPTAAERFAMVRAVAIFCVAFHSMKRGFELPVAVAAQVMQMFGGEGFIFNSLFGKNLRESFQAVVVRRNTDHRKIYAVAAMIEYRQAAASMQWALAGGSGFLFPSVRENGEKGKLALTPAQMTANLQAHLRAAYMEDKRYTLHSFRVGGATSHHMGGMAMDVLMKYAGWKSAAIAGRYVGVTASAAGSRGAERSRDTAFIDAYALPLSEGFWDSYAAFSRDNRGQSIP